MSHPNGSEPGFDALGLPAELLTTLQALGYEAPSPIQAATIPALLAGRDVLGQAQTGTGKTAAFALPILARLKPGESRPAALVLAPTRELAIQVAEAFQTYASGLPGFHVLPIYGGQAYAPQLNGLKRRPDVVVGTPGRIIDHLGKGTLRIDRLQTLVLDEADEMLRMGFIDDVRDVMERIPASCQKALFSATMPDPIRRIAERHMSQAEHITIRSKTTTATNIRQRYWMVSGVHKLDALTRILEVEEFDAMLVFARTRIATEQLAQRLEARGFSSAALNGDVPQKNREQIVDRLKNGEIDILAATDVAARGLDVERISHVVNYDIPHDTEAYVHRIGRTGRAGRSGEAILFVAPRERGMLRAIERATRQPIEPMALPTVGDVNAQRLVRFQARIQAALESDGLDAGRETVEQTLDTLDTSIEDLAAALAMLARGNARRLADDREPVDESGPETGRAPRGQGAPSRRDTAPRPKGNDDLVRYRIEVGAGHGVKPGNIVGAIANEAKLDSSQIGRINIQHDFSTVDLPANLAAETLGHLRTVRVASRPLLIRLDAGGSGQAAPGPGQPARAASNPKRPADKPAPADRPRMPDKNESRDQGGRDTRKKPDQPDKPRPARPARTRAERKARFKSRKGT
ncbi:MAG: DEAD/DEAH box helicase [Pseudomonadota bacterium]|nr:MAG: DEAD/DEAH box helicase [Pseudomonadota bacterium]